MGLARVVSCYRAVGKGLRATEGSAGINTVRAGELWIQWEYGNTLGENEKDWERARNVCGGSLVDVVAAGEEDGRDDARLEEADLERLLGQLEKDHGRSTRDAGEHFGGGRLGAVELRDS